MPWPVFNRQMQSAPTRPVLRCGLWYEAIDLSLHSVTLSAFRYTRTQLIFTI